MAGTVEDVSDKNYKKFTEAPAALVAYGLATCEPCKAYDPILEQAAAKFPHVKVGKAKMHVPGRCREIKKQHRSKRIPRLISSRAANCPDPRRQGRRRRTLRPHIGSSDQVESCVPSIATHPCDCRSYCLAFKVMVSAFVVLFWPLTLCPASADMPVPVQNTQRTEDRRTNDQVGTDGAPLIFIPAGEFLMGSQAGQEDERPAHHVYLDAFYIDKYEVTTGRYAKFMRVQRPTRPFKWQEALRGRQAEKPVIGVDWYDAKEYCEWAGRRLPTEAEWEKAARGTDHRTYPWGEDAPTRAYTNAGQRAWKGYDTLTAVGSHAPGHSPDGVADLSGNVWEWIADRYDQRYYETSPSRNPRGPSTGPLRVLRGGAWNNDATTIRGANRAAYAPAMRRNDVGFRCAMDGATPSSRRPQTNLENHATALVAVQNIRALIDEVLPPSSARRCLLIEAGVGPRDGLCNHFQAFRHHAE